MERKLVYMVGTDTVVAYSTNSGRTPQQTIAALARWVERMVRAYDPSIEVTVELGADNVTEYPQPPEELAEYKYRWIAGLFWVLDAAEEGWRLEMATR